MFNRKQSRREQTASAIAAAAGSVIGSKIGRKKPSRAKRVAAAGSIVTGVALIGSAFNKKQDRP